MGVEPSLSDVFNHCHYSVASGNNELYIVFVQFGSVQSLSRVRLFATP